MKNSSKVKKSKRLIILLSANIAFFIITLMVCVLVVMLSVSGFSETSESTVFIFYTVFGGFMQQATFTALSLAVYYISIIAGALDEKYKSEVDDMSDNK